MSTYYRSLIQSISALKSGLIAAYKFESNGNDSYSTYNGTVGTSVTFSTTNAVDGLAGQFTRVINSRITLPTTGNAFSFTNGTTDRPFSIKANIYLRGLGVTQTILGKYSGSANNTSEYFFYVRPTNQLAIVCCNRLTGNVIIGAQTAVLSLNTAYNVVVTYDASGTFGGFKIYINGVSQTLTNISSGTGYVGMGITALNPVIGNIAQASATFAMGGMIDELYVFNRVITQAEVTTLQSIYFPNF